MIKVGKKLRSHKPGRTQKVKPASGVRSRSRSSKRRPPFETVRFVYPGMSEWSDYKDIFGQLARKLGGDRVSVSGVMPVRGGGAFISECELPRKIASQFKAEFKTYYSMLIQRQKDRMKGAVRKAILDVPRRGDPNLDPIETVMKGETLLKAGLSREDYETLRRVYDHVDTQAWLNTLL